MKDWSVEQLVNFVMNALQDGFLLNPDIKEAISLLKSKS